MKKTITKIAAVTMAIVMLTSVVTSCSPGGKGGIKVKADDPWYETSRFKLEKEVLENDIIGSSGVCVSDDKIFSIYCTSADRTGKSRTVLDSYDLDGSFLKRQEVTYPEGSTFYKIYTVKVDPEGKTISAIIYIVAEKEYGPMFVDIDTETGNVVNTKNAFSKEANKVRRGDSYPLKVDGAGDYAIIVLNCSDGAYLEMQLLLFKDTEFVCELDTSSVELLYLTDGFLADESNGSLYLSSYVANGISTLEYDLNTGKLKSEKNANDVNGNEINWGDYASTDKGDMCMIDTLGNITTIDPESMTSKTLIDTNWYTPYFYAKNSNDYLTNSKILTCSEDLAVILDSERTTYGSDNEINIDYVRVLKRADKNPHAGKTVIELALLPGSVVTDYMARSIYEFNRTDNEYLIRMWDKHKTGIAVKTGYASSSVADEEQVYKMIQDLRGSDAPDIALNIQKHYAMRDNIFMDLDGFLDKDVMDKQFTNIFDAAKVNGKQYFLPVTLEIEGLVTNKDLIGPGAVGITFEDFDKLIKENMDGYSPYDYTDSVSYTKHAFILSCIDIKGSIEGEKVDFGTDQFRKAAEYAKDNIEYDEFEQMPIELIGDWNRYRGESYYSEMDDFLDYVYACFKAGSLYSIIGTPSVDAKGPRYRAIETISVSASTDVKDGCKKFLNYLYSGKAFESEECSFRQIVTNKDVMAKNLESLSRINNEGFERYQNSIKSGAIIPAPGYSKVYGDKDATEDMRQIFLDTLSTISTYYFEDYEISKLMFEELAPYFKGDCSIDDAIKFINDRATKYVKEM